MIYEVLNQPKKIETALLDSAVLFACEFLQIETDFTVEFASLKNYQFGLCDYDEDEIVVILAKRLAAKDAVRTLFHELVHVKQYIDGRLEPGSPQIWMGKPVTGDYEKLPWEIEAYYLEEKMMEAFYS
jgi:hypothetical protein